MAKKKKKDKLPKVDAVVGAPTAPAAPPPPKAPVKAGESSTGAKKLVQPDKPKPPEGFGTKLRQVAKSADVSAQDFRRRFFGDTKKKKKRKAGSPVPKAPMTVKEGKEKFEDARKASRRRFHKPVDRRL